MQLINTDTVLIKSIIQSKSKNKTTELDLPSISNFIFIQTKITIKNNSMRLEVYLSDEIVSLS